MNDNHNDDDRLYLAQVNSITDAVAKMLPTFGPRGFSPEAIFEGAIKGAALVMIAGRNLSGPEIGDLLAAFAEGFHNNPPQRKDKFHVVE